MIPRARQITFLSTPGGTPAACRRGLLTPAPARTHRCRMNDHFEVSCPSLVRLDKYFLPYQIRWIEDTSRLKIIEKSRQIGMTYADAYDSVRKACDAKGMDVWVSSRDQRTARQ